MKKSILNYSRLFSLLFLILITISCEKKNSLKVNNLLANNLKTEEIINDSITISVNFKTEGRIGFNIKDKYYQYYCLDFFNNSQKDTTIVKKIPRIHKNQLIDFYGFKKEGGMSVFFEKYFLIDNNKNELFFNFSDGNAKLITDGVEDNINKIHSDFNKLDIKIKKLGKLNDNQKVKLNAELEKQYSVSLIKTNEIEKELVKTYYISILQKIYPFNKKIDEFIGNVKNPIACNPFSSILFNYTNDRIEILNFGELNKKNYTKEYVDILSIGLFNFLRFEKNKSNNNYNKAKEWLTKSDLFYADNEYIKNEIKPKNNLILKQKLEKLTFLDSKDNELEVGKVVKNKNSKYYLIDFWATWCAPCIQNIKSIHGMDLPKDLETIYISMDKLKDKEKWLAKSKELNLQNSYFIVGNENNKSIIKEIELNQLPRYILVDKDFNILNINMTTPQEGDFLKVLKSYIKY